MIYLLYGSGTWRSREKLNEIIEEFRSRAGANLNYYIFDAEEESPDKIKGALQTGALFAAKKLVVLKYFSASPYQEDLYKILETFKDDLQATIILWDRELEGPELKKLRAFCQKVQEFSAVGGSASGGKEASVFALGDTFFVAKREALRNLLKLISQGHDDFNLFSYLANHARKLLVIKSYDEQGKAVPASSGIHPYVAKKAVSMVRSFSREQLHYFFRRFFEEDHRIKTGISRPQDSLLAMLLERNRK